MRVGEGGIGCWVEEVGVCEVELVRLGGLEGSMKKCFLDFSGFWKYTNMCWKI